jgi:Protein of unknown function (DUF3108)
MRWALAVMLAACSHALPPPVVSSAPVVELRHAPFFVPGEQITWDVQVLGLAGARARMAVGEVGEVAGHRVVAATLEVESAGLVATVRAYQERTSSWIDVDSGVPMRTEARAEVDGKLSQVEAVRQGARAELSVAGEVRRLRLPSLTTHDPVSAMLLLRAWHGSVGSRGRYDLLDGQRLWRTEIVVDGRETIEVPLGRRAALRMSGSARSLDDPAQRPRRFTYWFSDDDEHLPLRVLATTAFGTVDMRATSYVGLRSSAAVHSPPASTGN